MSRSPSRAAVAACLVAFLVTVSVVGGAARAATAAIGDPDPWSAGYPKSVPHPNFPNTVKLWIDADGKTWNTPSGALESNRLKKLAANALHSGGQSVPSSFWKRQMDAMKAGTSSFPSAAKVMEQGNLTKYSGGSILVKEGKIPPTASVANKITRPTIPMTGAGPVSKLLSGATAPMLGLTVGLAAGNVGARIFGFKDEMLCQEQAWGVRAAGFVLNGVDCSAYDNAMEEQHKNANELVTAVPKTTCVQGVCINFLGIGKYNTNFPIQFCAQQAPASGYPAPYTGATTYWIGLNGGNPDSAMGFSNSTGALNGCSMFSGTNRAAWAYKTVAETGFKGVGIYLTGPGGIKSSESRAVLGPDDITKANPIRTFECKVIAETGEGYYKASQPFKEGDESLSGIQCPDAPPGKVPHKVEIREKTDGGSNENNLVYEQPVNPEYKELMAKYPECATGNCLLDLRVAGYSCFEGETDCAEWFTDPNKATKYSCKYGTHAVDLAECNVYAQLFKEDNAAGGSPWADPQDGSPVPGGPMTQPSQSPLMDKGVKTADEPRDCFPTGWAAFNPVNWVLQPVQCALEWAFVPRPAVVESKAAEVMQSWRETPPGALLNVIDNWDLDFTISGCDGFVTPWTYTAFGGSATTPLGIPSACPGEPFAEFAGWVRLVGSMVWIVTSALVIRRHAGASIGFNS